MSRAFDLDPGAAREANTGGKRITETGKYIGTVRVAFYEKNGNGTESINFMFDSDGNQEAGPLTVYTHNSAGEPLAGYKLVNAIMTCCQLRSITTKPLPVELYDYDAGKVVEKTKDVYAEFSGKRLGLVLQEEEYQKTRGGGGIGTRLIIAAPFSAQSELMAAEILDKKTSPDQLGKFMEYIAKNPVRKIRNKPASASVHTQQSQQSPTNFDDFDDDIPF